MKKQKGNCSENHKKNQLQLKNNKSITGGSLTTAQITRIAMMIAFVSAMSFIRIPLPFSENALTAQTLAVNIIALVLTPKEALVTMGCYWLLGLVGVPVFGGMAGPGKMFGPGGGYFMAFPLAVLLIGWLKGKTYHLGRYIAVTIFVGLIIINGLGLCWFKMITNVTWETAFLTGFVAFAPLDIAKCVMACLVAKPVQNIYASFQQRKGGTRS